MAISLVHDTCKAFPSTSKAFLSTSCETAHENLKKLITEVYKVFRTFCRARPFIFPAKEKSSWPPDWAEYFPNSQSVVQFCTKVRNLDSTSRFKIPAFSYFTSPTSSTEDAFLNIKNYAERAYEASANSFGNAKEVCDIIFFDNQALEKRVGQAFYNVFDSCRSEPIPPTRNPVVLLAMKCFFLYISVKLVIKGLDVVTHILLREASE